MARIIVLIVSCIYINRISGADFQNLGFDNPNTDHLQRVPGTSPNDNYFQGSVRELLPGWTPYSNGDPYDGAVYYPVPSINVPSLTYTAFGHAHQYVFHFTFNNVGGVTHEFRLQQAGRIPADAWEMRTYGHAFVYLNGVELAYRVLPGFNQGAFDVHDFAGQDATLEIRNYSSSGIIGGIEIDILGFAIPEPSEWALLLLGGGMLFWAVRRGSGSGRR